MKYKLFKEDGYSVVVNRDENTDRQIVNFIIDLFKKHRCGCPESVADNEEFQCEGSSILAEIAEMLELCYDDENEDDEEE